jgi:hypothetical protein
MAGTQMVGHMVYFTLIDNSEAAKQKLIDACNTHLKRHPGVVICVVGTLIADLEREVNDRGFDVALQMVFESRQAHDEYQVHARHKQFIEENKPNWKQVRVFDANVA